MNDKKKTKAKENIEIYHCKKYQLQQNCKMVYKINQH